ncbi:segregation and condensation protein A [Tomitella biformata]|uniref:segregation and condensation protein A n=1 Tax=Tomitella biformata TaxID=630403 RepID=UPI000465700F|nr:segregation/condensation protein A [Tomitella biformata]
MTAGADVQTVPASAGQAGFTVRLRNFEGPFDLLLQLIGQHRLDVTEVALHTVTDDFIAYTKQLGSRMDLDQTTEFLVVAATLLDLKAARLLPAGEVEDDEDLALLEMRDLLFARILQYRAYKQVAELFAELESAALRRYPADVGLEDKFTELLPEVTIGVSPWQLADIAAAAMRPRLVPTVNLDHLHTPRVSVQEQAARILEILQALAPGESASFSQLVAECTLPVEIVARFLGLLELYRQKSVSFEQDEALEELRVSWTGGGDSEIASDEEYG